MSKNGRPIVGGHFVVADGLTGAIAAPYNPLHHGTMGGSMAKVLRCNDLMPGCPYEAKGDSEADVLAQAAEHAKTAHGIAEIPAGMIPQIKGAIRDVA